MHRIRDCHLPEPYRTWIDRAAPLPAGVTVIPRTISPWSGGLLLFNWALGCVGIGLPMAILVPRAGMDPTGWAVVGLITAALVGVLLLLAYRLFQTICARHDQNAGVLRQGILIGREGVLVRVMPNRCYPVPMDEFVRAENWSGGGENGGEYLRVMTTSGHFDILDEHITADAVEVNRAVATARAGSADRRRKRK